LEVLRYSNDLKRAPDPAFNSVTPKCGEHVLVYTAAPIINIVCALQLMENLIFFYIVKKNCIKKGYNKPHGG
jgi:hypothetical protein